MVKSNVLLFVSIWATVKKVDYVSIRKKMKRIYFGIK